jgi:hypothetical protein
MKRCRYCGLLIRAVFELFTVSDSLLQTAHDALRKLQEEELALQAEDTGVRKYVGCDACVAVVDVPPAVGVLFQGNFRLPESAFCAAGTCRQSRQ